MLDMFRPTRPKLSMSDYVRPRKSISTEFDRGVFFSTEKNFDRDKTFRLCTTKEKRFDWARSRSLFDQEKFRPRKTLRLYSIEEKSFDWVRPRILSTKKHFERRNLFGRNINSKSQSGYLRFFDRTWGDHGPYSRCSYTLKMIMLTCTKFTWGISCTKFTVWY